MGLRSFFNSFLDEPSLPTELHPFIESSAGTEDDEISRSKIEDFSVEIGPVSAEKAYLIDEKQNRVVIDPQRGDWEESKSELKEVWTEDSPAGTEDAFELYLSMEANKRDVEDVCEFFEPPILQPKQHGMLEKAYHVSIYFSEFDVSYDEEQRRRDQLTDNYDDLARNLPSLCSAGYLDEGELFRQMYYEFEPDYEAYQRFFDKLVRHRPFVIFVRSNTIASEIHDLIDSKSNHLDRLSSEFNNIQTPTAIEVRGIGSSAHEKIMSGREMLEEEHPDVMCVLANSSQSPNGDETVLIIESKTL